MSGVLQRPECRFCRRPWRPPPGVDASTAYCPECHDEREELARQHFASDGKIPKMVGKYILRVLPHKMKEDADA